MDEVLYRSVGTGYRPDVAPVTHWRAGSDEERAMRRSA